MGNSKNTRFNVISGYLERFIKSKMPKVAYFSSEFSVDVCDKHSMNEKYELAGDIMSVANEFSLPIVGIGLIGNNKSKGSLVDTGIEVSVNISRYQVYCKVWLLEGKNFNKIYLIDTELDKNPKEYRNINSSNKLYKDIALGMLGMKLISEKVIDADIYHFNGEYALFSLIYMLQQSDKNNIEQNIVLEEIKKKCVLTIHNSIDNMPIYSLNLIKEILGENIVKYFEKNINKVEIYKILNDKFKVTNGTSIMHSRYLCKKLKTDKKNSISYVTNGIHIPTWIDEPIIKILKESDKFLSERRKLKISFIEYVEEKTGKKLDPDKLLIGFCGISKEFKRNDLILRKKEVIEGLLADDKLQLVFSLSEEKNANVSSALRNLKELSEKYQDKVINLGIYNRENEKELVKGVDLWINSSRKPSDPCDMIAIKAAMNGVLNLSTMSGCWPEVCVEGINGWQIGSGTVVEKKNEQDDHDVSSLYDVLTTKIVPTYYENSEKWNDMILQSIKSTIEYFDIERMIIEYYDKLYK